MIIREFYSTEKGADRNIGQQLFNESVIGGIGSEIAGIISSTCAIGTEESERVIHLLQKYYGSYDE